MAHDASNTAPHHYVEWLAHCYLLRFATRHPQMIKNVVSHRYLGTELEAIIPGEFALKSLETGEAVLQALEQRLTELEQQSLPFDAEQVEANLTLLGNIMGLSQVEISVIRFMLAAYSVPELKTMLNKGYEQNFHSGVRAMAIMLAAPHAELTVALEPAGKLKQSGLVVSIDDSFGRAISDTLTLPSVMMTETLIRGVATQDNLLASLVTPSPEAELSLADYSYLEQSLALAHNYVKSADQHHTKPMHVLLFGQPGTGKTELAKTLVHAANSTLYVPQANGPAAKLSHPLTGLMLYQTAQHLLPAYNNWLLMDDAEQYFQPGYMHIEGSGRGRIRNDKQWLIHTLEHSRIPTIWIVNHTEGIHPALLRRFNLVLEIKTPPHSKRLEIAERALAGSVSQDQLKRLTQLRSISPALLKQASATLTAAGCLDQPDQLNHYLQHAFAAQGDHAGVHELRKAKKKTWFDPAFINSTTNIATVVQALKHQPTGKLCLHGDPGTGKSAFAQWLAQELSMPIHSVKASDLLGAMVGQSEKNLSMCFQQAEDENTLLLIDEIDSFLYARNTANTTWQVTLVNEFLTQLEDFQGLFIGTTNRIQHLDQAAHRRFELKIEFLPLTKTQIMQALSDVLAQHGLSTDGLSESFITRELSTVTNGDIAVVTGQTRFSPLVDAKDLLQRLVLETQLKRGRARIGF